MANGSGQNYSSYGPNPTTDNTSQTQQQTLQPLGNSNLKNQAQTYEATTPQTTSVNQTNAGWHANPTVDMHPNVQAGITFSPSGGGIKGYHLTSVRRQGAKAIKRTVPLDMAVAYGFQSNH